jgi:Putative zinc-finger
MKDCDHVRSQLSGLIDGELSPEESRAVEDHLQSCLACRQEWETLSEIDSRLAGALTIQNLDRKYAAILTQAANANQIAERGSTTWHAWRLVSVGALAVAAILLLAMWPFFMTQDDSRTTIPSLNLVAQLTRATGPIQFLPAGETDWTEISSDTKKSFVAGSRLKTSTGVLCELETTSKGVLRLNESAEVVFVEPNRVELIAGQLWCLTPQSNGIEVVIPEASKQTPAPLIFACPSSTEIQCVANDRSASCDSVSPNNPTTTMTLGGVTCAVAPGESVRIDKEQNIERKQSVDASSKIWQLPLLAVGTEVDSELVLLLDRLLAPIGMTKARSLNEEQLRMLGPAGAIPLLAYASVENSPDHLHLRRTAIRLASELVDERGIRLLTQLTGDRDEYISGVAQTTLQRLKSPAH